MDINREEELLKKIKRNLFRKTKITDNSITDLRTKMGWRGTGTESDPIIINDLLGLKPKIWIRRGSLQYVIQDVVVYNLKCRNTQNIVIENCKINEFELEGCYNITIRNNSILELDFVYSKGCTLESNAFSSDVLERLESNFFDKIYAKTLKVIYCAFSLTFILAFLIFAFSLSEWPYGILDLCFVAFLFYFILTLNIKRKRTQKKPENILTGNSRLSDSEKKEILHEILENYNYL